MALNLGIISIIGGSGGGGLVNIPPTAANFAALPAAGSFDGAMIETVNNNYIYVWNQTGGVWVLIAGPGFALTATGTASINSTITADVISSVLNVSTTAAPAGTQGISNIINAAGSTGLQSYFPTGALGELTSSVLQFTGAGKMVGNTYGITVNLASGTTSGYLSTTDWNTFNNKQGALVRNNVSSSTSGMSIGNGISAIISASPVTIDMQAGSTASDGYLTATAYNLFNNKQDAVKIGPFSYTSYGQGATIFGATFQLGWADGTNPGSIGMTHQTMGGGNKTFAGTILGAAGTTGAPEFSFSADTDTGIYNPAANTLALVTGATEYWRIASTGVTSVLKGTYPSMVFAGASSGLFTLNPGSSFVAYTNTLPLAQGATTTFLQNDGAGVLSWAPLSYSWSGRHDNSVNNWYFNTAAYTDPTSQDANGNAIVEIDNNGFGTVSSYVNGAAKYPGIVFTPPRIGRYRISASCEACGAPSLGQFGSWRLTDGTTVITAITHVGVATTDGLVLTGVLNVASLSSITIKIQGYASATSCTISNTGVAAGMINWSIELI